MLLVSATSRGCAHGERTLMESVCSTGRQAPIREDRPEHHRTLRLFLTFAELAAGAAFRRFSCTRFVTSLGLPRDIIEFGPHRREGFTILESRDIIPFPS